MQSLQHLAIGQERTGNRQRAAGAPHSQQLAVAEQLPDPAHGDAKAVSHFWKSQPVTDERVGRGVNLCHVPNFPHQRPDQTRTRLIHATSGVESVTGGSGTGPPRRYRKR